MLAGVRIDWFARTLEALRDSAPQSPAAEPLLAGLPAAAGEKLRRFFPADPQRAAVLVPIVEHAEPTFLLTVRAAHLARHAGQISFPGGRVEAGDTDAAAAALREAQEEIGIPRDSVRVVGYLPDLLIMSGYRITPVVGVLQPGFDLRLDEREVRDVFEMPLSHAFDPLNHRPRRRRIEEHEIEARDIPYGEHNVWGATAGILLTLYELISHERAA